MFSNIDGIGKILMKWKMLYEENKILHERIDMKLNSWYHKNRE